MTGIIVWPKSTVGTWLVEFPGIPPGYDENGLYIDGILPIEEEDLRLIWES